MDMQIVDNKIHFDCGCSFDVVPGSNPVRIKFDPNVENMPLDCKRTWDLIGDGNTKGVFQLESRFGQQYAKKLKPQNIEQLAALSAILRPGCVSGDALISICNTVDKSGHVRWRRKKMSELYSSFVSGKGPQRILSYDEENHRIVSNKIADIMHNGTQDVYAIKYRRLFWPSRRRDISTLKCTIDHPLLVLNKGWTKLEDMQPGDRFAIISRQSKKYKDFKQICFDAYEYKCIFCDWNEGSLDVNHIDGNRKVNNSADNLCFMCPNHHRMYSEKSITKEQVLSILDNFKLTKHDHIYWGIYEGKTLIGAENVYDIMMEGPHNNFIADNIIVHNCTQAFRDGKNVAEHYMDRKNGLEPVSYFHPALESILGSTFGEMIYQEQAMKIAQDIAGFTLEQADNLRKAIGKKKADIMAQVKIEFLEGCKRIGIVTDEQAEELFGWIEKSQRYSFNKSHAVSYAMNGYAAAYGKAHFPASFFTSYLYFSKDKQDTFDEIKLLVSNAKLNGLKVSQPDFRKTNAHFKRLADQLKNNDTYNPYDDVIYFGFADIKGIGEATIPKILTAIFQTETILGKDRKDWSWLEFLVFFSQSIGSTAAQNMIEVGALDYMNVDRQRMIYEYNTFSELTDKEKAWIRQNVKLDNTTYLLKDVLKKTFDWYEDPKNKENAKGRPYHTSKQLEKAKTLYSLLLNPPYSLIDTADWKVRVEDAKLGLPITTSLLDGCMDVNQANCTCTEFLKEQESSKNIFMAVQIDEIKPHITGNGDEMAFITISDADASLDVVVFPKDWATINKSGVCIKENTVMISGMRSDRGGLIVKKMWQLS